VIKGIKGASQFLEAIAVLEITGLSTGPITRRRSGKDCALDFKNQGLKDFT